MLLTKLTTNLNTHQSLPDQPALPAEELKRAFDEAPNAIKTYINEFLLEELDVIINSLQDKDVSLRKSLDTATTNVNKKAPISHASTESTYGLATSTNYGHTKIINNLTTESSSAGQALNAYQGKVLKDLVDGKAPISHASSNTTYGIGTTSNYGHCKTINSLTRGSYIAGEALSAYQGKILSDNISSLQLSVNSLTVQIADLKKTVQDILKKIN